MRARYSIVHTFVGEIAHFLTKAVGGSLHHLAQHEQRARRVGIQAALHMIVACRNGLTL